jgi:hypothetical protein
MAIIFASYRDHQSIEIQSSYKQKQEHEIRTTARAIELEYIEIQNPHIDKLDTESSRPQVLLRR